MIGLLSIMSDLSAIRPVFHSEADFQHALAWQLHEAISGARIRLERRPFPDERLYVDIWMETENVSTAIELKYLTRGLSAEVKGERYRLQSQAAQDLRRYDFVKDLVRLERVVDAFPFTVGYAILLTNDSSHWHPPKRLYNIDAAFRISEGQTLERRLEWAAHAGRNTIAGRDEPLSLRGRYSMRWRDYSVVGGGAGGTFRYLLVEVQRGV